MGIYIFNIISIAIYGILIKNKKLFIWIAGIQLFIILALRNVNIGPDLENYAGGYQFISSLSLNDLLSRIHFLKNADLVWPYTYESGYVILCWIAAKIGLSFHGYLVLLSLLSISLIMKFIYMYSEKPWLSIIMFIGLGYYGYAFGILRQTLAVAICLYSIPFMEKRKWVHTVALYVVAFSIHRSSLIFLLLHFLTKIKIKKNILRKYLLACVMFLGVAPVIYSRILTKIFAYMGKSVYIASEFSFNMLIVIMFIIAFLLLNLIREDVLNINPMVTWGFFAAFPVEIIGMCNDGVARAVEYYLIFLIILLPNVISNYGMYRNEFGDIEFSQKLRSTRYIITGLVFCAMFYLMIHNLNGTPLVPYEIYRK